MPKLKAQQVFTPSSFPAYTYINREEKQYEENLQDALSTPGLIISLSGPSKSGKTVLVEKVVGMDNLISITGAGIEKPADVWEKVLDWMDVPSESSVANRSESSGTVGGDTMAKVEVLGTGLQFTAKGSKQNLKSQIVTSSNKRRGIQQVIAEIGGSDYTILIDDFHYMPREVQEEVAKQLKEAAQKGVKIITASVAYRSDDVVRALPELRGRVHSIDLAYWSKKELASIATDGFALLNMTMSEELVDGFVNESAGSPQLMQNICLRACFSLKIRETSAIAQTFDKASTDTIDIYERTVASTDFRSLVEVLDNGPRVRGTERKDYQFVDGTVGDVYRCILKAVAADPPTLSFPYAEIVGRAASVCKGDAPIGSSISGSCMQMAKLALVNFPKERVLDWDESKSVLDLPDPYLLFYLRWSAHLKEAIPG